ncbi:MAG: molybdate ABC transporter substrate-binding protein [Actinomycetota bacterium]
MRSPTRVLAGGIILALTACFPAATGSPGESSSPAPIPLRVFADSSLTQAFSEIGADFEFLNDGAQVAYSFGPSGALATEIQRDRGADVFASAGEPWMDAIDEEPGWLDRSDFVENSLVIVTPVDDPGDVSSIDDLARPGVSVVIGARGTPIGDDTREMLVNAELLVEILPNIEEPNAADDAAIVTRVESGEVDAGITYLSDVSDAAGHDLRAVSLDGGVNVTATYPIAVLAGTPNEELARRFMAYVRGPEGQATLEAYGFDPLFLG